MDMNKSLIQIVGSKRSNGPSEQIICPPRSNGQIIWFVDLQRARSIGSLPPLHPTLFFFKIYGKARRSIPRCWALANLFCGLGWSQFPRLVRSSLWVASTCVVNGSVRACASFLKITARHSLMRPYQHGLGQSSPSWIFGRPPQPNCHPYLQLLPQLPFSTRIVVAFLLFLCPFYY